MKTQISKYMLLLTAALILCGCSTPAPLTLIADACDAAIITIPILEATGIVPTGIGNIILAYASAASEAASKSAAELLTKDTAAQKAEKITQYFAAAAAPLLPGNVGPEALAIVKAIESAVNLFLTQFNGPAGKKAMQNGTADQVHLSMGERHGISAVQKRLLATSVKAKGLIKK